MNEAQKELLIANIMGIIIRNSEGIVNNPNDQGAGYAERVYLNIVKQDLTDLLN